MENFCFDFVIATRDHDKTVERYETILGMTPIELDPESMPEEGSRCTVFLLWNEGDKGMCLSIISSTFPDSIANRQLDKYGEGLVLFGIDVPDVNETVARAKQVGVEFVDETPMPYDYGELVFAKRETTNNIPFFFSLHKKGWWEKTLNGGKDVDKPQELYRTTDKRLE